MDSHLLISTFDDPGTLDPHRAYDATDRHPVLNMYDSLLAMDTDGTVRPAIGAEPPTITEGLPVGPIASPLQISEHCSSIASKARPRRWKSAPETS